MAKETRRRMTDKVLNKVKELEDKVDTLYGIVAQCLTRKEVEKILKEFKE